MRNVQTLNKQQAATIIGGYRTYKTKEGCESREGKGNCFKDKKSSVWMNRGGVYTTNK